MSLVFQIRFQPAPVRPWVCAFARPPRTCVAKRGSQPDSTSDQPPAMQNANMEIFILHWWMYISIYIYIIFISFSISSFDAIKIGRGPSVGQKLMTFVCFFCILTVIDMVCVQLKISCDCAHPELWMNGSTSFSFAYRTLRRKPNEGNPKIEINNDSTWKLSLWGAGARTSWTSWRHGDGPSASKVPSSGVCLAQGRLRPSALLLRNRIVFESNTMTMSACPVNVPKWQNSLQTSSVISTREISLSRFDSEMQLQAQEGHCHKIWHSTRKRKWKGHKKCAFSKSTAMKLHISVTTVISPHPS